MPHDVFISHSSGDKLTADATVAALESQGIRCWVAPRDVVPGVQWANAIVQAITECQLMVLVFSSETNDSHHIVREVELAAHHRKPIIPLRVENVVPNATLDYYIAGTHWLDAMDPPLEAHLERLTTVVQEMLERHVPAGSGPSERQAASAASGPDGAGGAVAVLAPNAPEPTSLPSVDETPVRVGEADATTLLPAPPPGPGLGGPAAEPPPRRRPALIALITALLLLSAGGASAAFLLAGGEDAREAAPSPSAVVPPPSPAGPSPSAAPAPTVRAPQHVRAAAATAALVRLRWDPAPFGAAVDHYLVLRDGETIAEVTEGLYVDDEVEPAQTYVYRIVAIGADGSRARSKALTVTTEALPVAPAPGTGSDGGGGGGSAPPPPPPEETCSAIDHFEGKC